MLGWAGLRGAVPVVFATFAVTEGIEGGLTFFNVTFFVVLLSTVLQGTTIEPRRAAARRAAPTRPRSPRRWSSRCCSTGSARR